MSLLHQLAEAAGIAIQWRDVNGTNQTVSDDSLRAVLLAIGLPAANEALITASLLMLEAERGAHSLPLITASLGEPVLLSGTPGPYRVTLESGGVITGEARKTPRGISLDPITEPGYHQLELGGFTTTLAAAPKRAYTLEDAAGPNGGKLWGLSVQLYSLRRAGDGGIGDFTALAELCHHAAAHGAAAIAISPAHALFSADVTRYGPYAPSNRAALNVLHIAQSTGIPDDSPLIDWPSSAAAKLKALREKFDAGYDAEALAAYRAQSGTGLERHAIFEAISATLSKTDPAALDWRNWPDAYQHPENTEIAHFVAEHEQEVAFHAWLQMQAEAGLAAAHSAARKAGAKIGLISDLAVGTDHAGSATWSRPDAVLYGLEIGAPPDLINHEGQSWGITAFSPRGLRNSGFAAFIDMLRHALRHAGGVRIDHAMSLSRLWVIPLGMPSSQGAYLAMPSEDLMRLVILESHRHQAVILGEDLGTLPAGFDKQLNASGIAGLRVMWFEHDGMGFKPPSSWTPSAVAMTTTHDLPTLAGWWEARDIAWRASLNMQGDSPATRDTDRRALWSAFTASGATSAPQPQIWDGAAITYPAAIHLGRSACALALLPIEDALSLSEQPNLPGTTTQHPNWRRRLPADIPTLFAREDFTARLHALATARGENT